MMPVVLEVLPWGGIRDPFSMFSHLTGAVLSVFALVWLWRRSKDASLPSRHRGSLLVYGVTLLLTFGASTLFHLPNWSAEQLTLLKKLDHAAIFLLIAGTGGAVYATVPKRWARYLTYAIWVTCLTGLVLKMTIWPMPLWLSALTYLAAGWITMLGAVGVLRRQDRHTLRPLLLGSLILSAGAIVFALEAPVVWPGVIEGHEVFHLLVLIGTALHFAFILQTCSGDACREAEPVAETVLAPAPQSALPQRLLRPDHVPTPRPATAPQFMRGSSGKLARSA